MHFSQSTPAGVFPRSFPFLKNILVKTRKKQRRFLQSTVDYATMIPVSLYAHETKSRMEDNL